MEKATLASGCFWCTEAIFKRLRGVSSVQSGYSGGEKENPTYDDVSSGTTGHAECIQITFDPAIIPYVTILEIFFASHDPTTPNRQGNDVGTQYRSAIFFHDDKQKETALKKREELENSGKFHDSIVTQIVPFTNFYPAEEHHKDYYDNNRSAPYCMFIIDPKVRKLMEHFRKEVKEEYKEN
jgi:peptide-methionine (S)-S-oxide reductase